MSMYSDRKNYHLNSLHLVSLIRLLQNYCYYFYFHLFSLSMIDFSNSNCLSISTRNPNGIMLCTYKHFVWLDLNTMPGQSVIVGIGLTCVSTTIYAQIVHLKPSAYVQLSECLQIFVSYCRFHVKLCSPSNWPIIMPMINCWTKTTRNGR